MCGVGWVQCWGNFKGDFGNTKIRFFKENLLQEHELISQIYNTVVTLYYFRFLPFIIKGFEN